MATSQIQTATTTAQAIINAASQDIRQQLAASGDNSNILLDYVNRCQLTLLRAARWTFLLNSDILYFITERERTDYWLGASGSAPAGVVDTNLNLTDLDFVLKNSVYDTTNQQQLDKVDVRPFSLSLTLKDAQFRPGPPAIWREDLSTPGVMNIYPAPDNENNYTPVPQSPYLTTTAGGALALRTYYVNVTFVDSSGNEGLPATREAVITIPASKLVTVKSPVIPFNTTASGVIYNQYKVYASTTSNGELVQNSGSAINIGTDWTEPTGGLVTGTAALPTANNLTQMDGYLISFRYYKQRQIVTDPSITLQIPDVYKDILVAGVNWLSTRYLRLHQEAQMWQMEFNDGIRQIIKDQNLMPRENDFINPDKVGLGIGSNVPYQDFFGGTFIP